MANAGGIRAGRSFVEMFLFAEPLVAGLKSAERQLHAFGKSVGIIGAAISGIGTAITGPLLGAAKKFADVGSELNDMSARTGVSVEALSELGHAAGQTSTDMATVEGAIGRMQKALVKGSEENIQAEATFQALGLSVSALRDLSPEDQFDAIARSIGAIPDKTARGAAAMEVFGKSGRALLPMIADLDALTAEARAFGLVWTGEEAEKADALGDALDLLKATLGRIVTSVGSELAPLITEVAGAMARAAKLAIDWAKANGPLIVTAFKVGAAIVAAGTAITALGITIFSVGSAFGVLATVVAFILNPITLVVAALAGLATWFLTSTKAGGEALSWLGERFTELTATAVQAFGGIAAALKKGDIALAGQILWAELQLEWIKGTNAIEAIWRDWSGSVVEGYQKLNGLLASLTISGWAGIQSAWVNSVGMIIDTAAGAWSTIKSGWNSLWNVLADTFDGWATGFMQSLNLVIAEIKTQIAIAKGFLTASSSSHEIAVINKEAEGKNAKLGQDAASRSAARASGAKGSEDADAGAAKDREAARQSELAKIGQGEIDAQKALADMQKEGVEARRKANEDAVAADKANLDAAKANLAGLIGKANQPGEAPPVAPRGKGGPEGDLSPENLDKSIKQAKAKVSVSGAFAASAVQGLGAGDTVVVAEKQLDEQKKTNDHLTKLNKKVDKKEAAFK